jgi:tryptophan 2,3-dioxygenase
MNPNQPVHYSSYLQLEEILDAQHPESQKPGATPAHDEMLFIITHQAYELWFKQIIWELESVIRLLDKPKLDDNASDLQVIVHRLSRVHGILKLLVHQMDIMETMTPMDFLEFRDLLRPASGFQSWQFKKIEALLGLRFEARHGQHYYTSQLNAQEVETVKSAEKGSPLNILINRWLERMPFPEQSSFSVYNPDGPTETGVSAFWKRYADIYMQSLADAEKANGEMFLQTFVDATPDPSRHFSPKACRAALFIMLYRGYPVLQQPFQLLEKLQDIDQELANWRFRHFGMVQKMIGTRIGTGGSTGAAYLKGAMDKHYIYHELGRLSSFLIDRSRLPLLPEPLIQKLGYHF